MNSHNFSRKFSSTWQPLHFSAFSSSAFTQLDTLLAMLSCSAHTPSSLTLFSKKIFLRPNSYSLPSWVFSACVTLTDLFLPAILLHAFVSSALNCSHKVSYSVIFLQPDFIAPHSWKPCHVYFACLPSSPPPRHPLKHRTTWQILAEWLSPFSISIAKV